MQGLALTWPCYFYFGSAHPLLVGLKKKKKLFLFSLGLKGPVTGRGYGQGHCWIQNEWLNDCEPWFAKLLQAQKGPQQLKHKVFFPPFSLWLARTGGHCSTTVNGLWLENSVRKMGSSNCLQQSFIKHWYSFYGFGHLLQLEMFLVFPFCPFYLPILQFKIYFPFLRAHKEVWSHLWPLRKHWILG